LLRFIFSPAYTIDNLLMKTVKKFLNPSLLTLDVGCGEAKISKAYSRKSLYYGIDVEKRIDVHLAKQINFRIYDGKCMPFADDTFDQLLSMEVIEHVDNLDEILLEMFRVLKPKGKIIITVPFMWPEHEMPFDYRRFTANGLVRAMEKYGFKSQQIIKLGSAPVLTIFCINVRNRLRSILGKHISYGLMVPMVIICNVFSIFSVREGSTYSNVVYVGEK